MRTKSQSLIFMSKGSTALIVKCHKKDTSSHKISLNLNSFKTKDRFLEFPDKYSDKDNKNRLSARN